MGIVLNIPFRIVTDNFRVPLIDEDTTSALIPLGAVVTPFGGGAQIDSMVYFRYGDKEYKIYRWRFEQCADQAPDLR
jgi:hypothetical protein